VSGFADHECYDALGLVDRVRRKDVSLSDFTQGRDQTPGGAATPPDDATRVRLAGQARGAAVVRSQAVGR
jgi:hypothetical protein